LFAEAMRHYARQRLGEARLRGLYDKAAQWYEARGLLVEAIEALFAAQTFERAASLIDRMLEERPFFEWQTLRRWIEQLPTAVLDAHPRLNFNYAMLLLFTSERFAAATAAAVEVPLQAAERAWRASQDDEGLGKVLAMRSVVVFWQDDLTRAFACAREALELLPEDETYWRGVSLFNVGIEELMTGKIDSAQRVLMEARALCEAAQNIYAATAATLFLGEAYLQQAELDQAEQLYQQVLADVNDPDSMQDDRCQAEIGLGRVALERNDLMVAEAHRARALELAPQFTNGSLNMQAQLLKARLQQARGQIGPAQETLRMLAARLKHASLLREVYTWQARFALAAGDLAAAHNWAAVYTQHAGVSPLQQEQEALMLARLHIAEGQADQALALLEQWRSDAHTCGRVRSELECLCLKSLAYYEQAELEQARKSLLRALTIAQPKDCQRVFLDEGERLSNLLQTIVPDLTKRPLITFATLLLQAFAPGRSGQPAVAPAAPLLEPLSPQEQRVLRLLSAGLSNPEIARELVVSTNTIKTQVRSIYNKLNVNNRAEAADAARELKLL